MEMPPDIPPYHTSDKTSFAYISTRDRWPVILTGAIDDVHRAVAATTEEPKRTEGKRIIESLSSLKYELQHDRTLTPLADDGQPDIAGYNEELEKLGPPSWFSVPWLFAECYLYRRLSTLFSLSTAWRSYDVFARQKLSTFRSSRPAVIELAARYKEIIQQLSHQTTEKNEEVEKLVFMEMCEICLWGNATDLSLLTSLSYEDIQKLQGSKARKESENNILVNDLGAAYEALKSAQGQDRRVDIVLDNAGFELYVDLILSGYLIAAGLADTVVLHPKSIPWFVSDVIPADFAALLNTLADPQRFFSTPSEDEGLTNKVPEPLSEAEVDVLLFLFQHWSSLHQEGQLVLRPNRFWTEGGSYWRLPASDSRLFEDLRSSQLVIFKGDLNYRKLTGDVMWDPTTSFPVAVGPLGPVSGMNVLALRTCKADVVVGLKPGEDEKLRAMAGGGGESGSRKWAWNGKWAVVSYSSDQL